MRLLPLIALLLGLFHGAHSFISHGRWIGRCRSRPLAPLRCLGADLLQEPETKPAVHAREQIIASALDDVKNVINKLMILDSESGTKDLSSVASPLLLEHSRVLCKEQVYEVIIEEMLSAANSTEKAEQVRRINALVSGFVEAERRARARAKVNYVLAGASTNRLEEAIKMLSGNDEIDGLLMAFLDSLIRKEQRKATESMQPSPLDEERRGPGAANKEEAQKDTALSVLKMVRRRLKAEVVTRDQQEFRLLAALLPLDPSDRSVLLHQELTLIESIESFTKFVQEGVKYINENGLQAVDRAGTGTVQLPATTVAVMKDILLDLKGMQDKLITGYAGQRSFVVESKDDDMAM